MIDLAKIFLRLLPWLLFTALLGWLLFTKKFGAGDGDTTRVETHTVLTQIEQLGKMELLKYNFQEITEVNRKTDARLFSKLIPGSKGVLISEGSAVGCIDFQQIDLEGIEATTDTLFITLPSPEICYFKLNLDKSRMYDLQINYLSKEDRETFIQEIYQVAEGQIKQSALSSGILEQTRNQARIVLKPMLERLTDKKVVLQFSLSQPMRLEDL